MFWGYSFHYRKRSTWKHRTENGHTKFPYQTPLNFSKIISFTSSSKTWSQMPYIPLRAPSHLPKSRATMRAASFLPQHRSSEMGHMLWPGWECGQKSGETTNSHQPEKTNLPPLITLVCLHSGNRVAMHVRNEASVRTTQQRLDPPWKQL